LYSNTAVHEVSTNINRIHFKVMFIVLYSLWYTQGDSKVAFH